MRLDIRWSLAAGLFFAPFAPWGLSSAQAEDAVEAPEAITVIQSDYGPTGTLMVGWTAPGAYDALELAVDGQPAEGIVDGTSSTALLKALPGQRTIGVRALLGSQASPWTTAQFTVLDSSPIPDPIVTLHCEYIPEQEGLLRVTWQLGKDVWVSGRLEVPGVQGFVPIEAGALEATIPAGPDEIHVATLVFQSAASYCSPPFTPVCLPRIPSFRRGDCNVSGRTNITDPIFMLNHLFLGQVRWFCDDACDANDDGDINISDPIAILQHLFAGGPTLPPPGPVQCGVDPTDDLLGGLCRCTDGS